jgi:hypothetical protein
VNVNLYLLIRCYSKIFYRNSCLAGTGLGQVTANKKQGLKANALSPCFGLAPPVGLEPTTSGLTVRCSSSWADWGWNIGFNL